MTPRSVWRSIEPLALLLATGICLATIFPLGKLSQEQGVSALLYCVMTAFGASAVLALFTIAAGQSLWPNRETVVFSAIAGQLTFTIPWGCVLIVMPKVGSALPAIVQSVTPLATVAIAYAMRLEKPNATRILGLCIGFSGVLLILTTRAHQPGEETAGLGWYLSTIITPVVLAIGNVFRSTNWPKTKNHPLQLATSSLLAASVVVLGVSFLWRDDGPTWAEQISIGWPYLLAQAVATGVGYALFFRLQRIGGPIYVSQLSYVNTAMGVLFAILILAESLSLWTGLALVVTIIGILTANSVRADH